MTAEESQALIEEIKRHQWWQGSVFSGDKIATTESSLKDVEFWVIASQTCNIYNHCFEKVPVVELVGAREIDACESRFVRGDQPRTIHVQAIAEGRNHSLEIDIQTRLWLPREKLAEFSFDYEIVDVHREDPEWIKNQWLDSFSGWIARSYTRVTLPDEFNAGLQNCRIKEFLEKKLTDHADIYGIYFGISSKDAEEYKGPLGLMPPPYNLEIWIVTHEEVDPEKIISSFKAELFETKLTFKITDAASGSIESKKLTRAESASYNDLFIRQNSLIWRSIGDMSLLEAKQLVRYSMIDHLSDSSYSASI